MRVKHILALMLAVPAAALGQQPVMAPERLQDIMVFAGSAHYPRELADRGVQGRAVLATEIHPDGTLAPAVLVEPSGSVELDAAAPLVVANLKARPQVAAKPILLPVLFYKDSVESLPSKTCSEFNIDYTYYVTNYPAGSTGDMTVFKIAAGLAMAGGGINMSVIGQLKAAPDKTVAACAKRPSSKFMKEFLASLHA